MASSAGAPFPVAGGAPLNAASAHADTKQLDKLCEKALKAVESIRYAVAAAFYRRAAEEALILHGETFVWTYLTLQRALSLGVQAQLEGGTERAALYDEEWALTSACLPLIVRRMDDNTMLPGRGTVVELAFFKRYTVTRLTAFGEPPLSSRYSQLVGLSLGFATALRAATHFLALLGMRRGVQAAAFVLRVMDCMLPATRSLTGYTLVEEFRFADTIQSALSGDFTYDATFVVSIRARWTAAAMVQMRRERGLLDASEVIDKSTEADTARWRADVAEHGLKECALPSCDKREASVQQYKCCSPVAPFGAARRSTGRCTGRSTSPSAAQRFLRRRLPRKGARARREETTTPDVVGEHHRKRVCVLQRAAAHAERRALCAAARRNARRSWNRSRRSPLRLPAHLSASNALPAALLVTPLGLPMQLRFAV